jgi:hypothetical protein
MNAVGRDIAVVLNQGVEKKKFKESAGAASGVAAVNNQITDDRADPTAVNSQITD